MSNLSQQNETFKTSALPEIPGLRVHYILDCKYLPPTYISSF